MQRISDGYPRFSAFLSAMNNAIREPCAEASIRSSAAGSPCHKTAEPWVLAATILGSSMAFIDGTVVNVALPALQNALNATVTDVQWVIEAYSLLLSALLLVGGSLGDRYGRRRVFVIGVIIFGAASAWCGLASGIRPLIIGRALQGFGAALLVPGSLAIISSSFHEKDRGRAIGTWSGFSAITTAIGPVLGGWLIERLSWRAVFYINLRSPSSSSSFVTGASQKVPVTKKGVLIGWEQLSSPSVSARWSGV
jgi:MFS family permease